MNLINICSCSLSVLIVLCIALQVDSHGRMMEPTARGSRWRFNATAPQDYNDNEGFCGGFFKQWEMHDGKCGLCGNDFAAKTPRAHELGGLYGEGVIVKSYRMGDQIDVAVLITANHKGYFRFDLCNIDEHRGESEECFAKHPLKLIDGSDKYVMKRFETGWYNTTVRMPDNLVCEHCVFRWTYNTGNSWGTCPDGSGALGCGAQENFKGCSDISISK